MNQHQNNLILGIDEAGRGPVVGPLVLSGVWIEEAEFARWAELGVQDSKKYGSGAKALQRRAQLAAEIRRQAYQVEVVVIEAEQVDQRVRRNELNCLEQEAALEIIRRGPKARQIVADGARLFGPLVKHYAQLTAQDRAEENCLSVAAASVVAKAERDRRLGEIVAGWGLLEEKELTVVAGGGYANAATAQLLRDYLTRAGQWPSEVRRSYAWPVLRELEQEYFGGQQRIDYGD